MATSSRRLSAKSKSHRPSQTPGKDKGETCTKSPLKEWGRKINPYKLSSRDLKIYERYVAHTNNMNKG